ncbi:MAG: DUF1802 family protein [Planctomycetaceae bacterium]|nr:DUF1802 family protein [Planctomycetaceae bacterium]
MQAENPWALKEWAVVCAALAEGAQALVLRKGGIAEGPDGFQAEHPEFWLLPTQFHQSANQLRPDAGRWIERAAAYAPPAGKLSIDLYAVVESVRRIVREDELEELIPQQILARDTVLQRFHYRQPGLFALELRLWQRESPWTLPDLPAYAGCHSWVELDRTLSTDGLRQVVDGASQPGR